MTSLFKTIATPTLSKPPLAKTTLPKPIIALITFAALSACTTTPEPVETVHIEPPVVQTCYPLASLEKVTVPAVTKSGFSIVSIENPPEYYTDPQTGETVTIQNPPIETREPWTKIITPETHYYKSPEGVVVTDICELNAEAEAIAEAQAAKMTPEQKPPTLLYSK